MSTIISLTSIFLEKDSYFISLRADERTLPLTFFTGLNKFFDETSLAYFHGRYRTSTPLSVVMRSLLTIVLWLLQLGLRFFVTPPFQKYSFYYKRPNFSLSHFLKCITAITSRALIDIKSIVSLGHGLLIRHTLTKIFFPRSVYGSEDAKV